MIKKSVFAACVALSALTMTASVASASDEGEIKYRKSVMKSIGGHMGAIVGIMKQETGNAAHLKMHTTSMVTLSGVVGDLFPEGSDFGDTTVLPLVWEKPDDFAKAVQQFQDAAKGIDAAATSGDMAAVGAAMGELGKSCKNCHENFREKKKQ